MISKGLSSRDCEAKSSFLTKILSLNKQKNELKKKQRRPLSVAARAAPRPSASAQANDAVVGDIVRAARSKVGVVNKPLVLQFGVTRRLIRAWSA